jgi:NAD+ synthase (glutamine-hydrolysing)
MKAAAQLGGPQSMPWRAGLPRSLRVCLAQLNVTVGDLRGNGDKIVEAISEARSAHADVVCFPELTIPGYPPEDLVLKPDFVRKNREQLERIAKECRGITAVVGFVDSDGDVYNAAALLQDGKIAGVYRKCFLPNYSVFDEQRYFKAGRQAAVYVVNGVRLGLTICEDIWYPVGPATFEAAAGAEVVVNISSSPYSVGRPKIRERMIATRAQDEIAQIVCVNLVGGQDELVFDGSSFVSDWQGNIIARAPAFEESILTADLDVEGVFKARLHDTRRRQMDIVDPSGWERTLVIETGARDVREKTAAAPSPPVTPRLDTDEEIYRALLMGVRDYAGKNGFSEAVVGLSGGIDSSLTAVIAVDALCADKVHGVLLPSAISSTHSRTDAQALAANLGIDVFTVEIAKPFNALNAVLHEVLGDGNADLTFENLQARIRGVILMALNNQHNWLVLTTGNKSEVATGFSTLYGDTAGGFSVLKDVYKTTVYRLAHWRNGQSTSPLIPEQVLTKEPSAELAPGQKDSDRLPPYDVLDAVLRLYIEEDRSLDDIEAAGCDRAVAKQVIAMVDRNEFKRRQQPPGTRVSVRAFGKDRRLPITNGYRSE